MDKVFLDTNFFMRVLEGKFVQEAKRLENKNRFASVLTIHITAYVHKLNMPHSQLKQMLDYYTVLPITAKTGIISLEEPTKDYGDNLQLNTALGHSMTLFVTLDKELLRLKKYQGLNIISPAQLR
jgi:predicted nucleic acid-binding protein